MNTDKSYETANLIVEYLQQLLDAAGLHERANPIRGITVDSPTTARIVRDVLRQRTAPARPDLAEWWNIALARLEWTLEADTGYALLAA
jgi:hypothetical protein